MDEDECREYEYNESFKWFINEKSYIKELERKKMDNYLCMMQLNNILGNYEEVDERVLMKRQVDVVRANVENRELGDAAHFQKYNYEYSVFMERKNKGYDIDNVHGSTENLKIYNIYKKLRRGVREDYAYTKKINTIKDIRVRKMMEFLNMRKNVGQERIKDIVKMVCMNKSI